MSLILRLIARYALWLYILCGLGMVFYLRAALAARKEGSQAIFSLERESAAGRLYRSSGMILLLLLIVVGVYVLSHYVEIPTPAPSPVESPTPSLTETMPTRQPVTATLDVRTVTTTLTSTRRAPATPVAPRTAVSGTATATVVPAACPHANVQLTQPGQNQVIDAGVEVRGTATKPGFDRYEFKFRSRDNPDEWHWVETFRVPVSNGTLGFWRTSHLPPGNYSFMLIAIDRTGNSQECVVPVTIRR